MQSPITQLEQLTLTSASKQFLKETAKWAFFLSIIGFLLIFLMLILAVFANTIFSMVAMQPGIPENIGMIMTITYLVLAVIYFFPVYYLMQFANKMKKAIATKNDETLTGSFEMLKSHYKFLGVFTIITISLYILLIIFTTMGALA
ncbi:DUF5362 family protein [Polaribacter septentrionalilitoris]|uniref:DUF5362 family protein n=1 Tax=Polaribacter septentrionalilitoris TaxID=2494657 RepID=UPI001356EAFC|nr:DUF5362 family protein [Polaribacter septentrionalilitoris]